MHPDLTKRQRTPKYWGATWIAFWVVTTTRSHKGFASETAALPGRRLGSALGTSVQQAEPKQPQTTNTTKYDRKQGKVPTWRSAGGRKRNNPVRQLAVGGRPSTILAPLANNAVRDRDPKIFGTGSGRYLHPNRTLSTRRATCGGATRLPQLYAIVCKRLTPQGQVFISSLMQNQKRLSILQQPVMQLVKAWGHAETPDSNLGSPLANLRAAVRQASNQVF